MSNNCPSLGPWTSKTSSSWVLVSSHRGTTGTWTQQTTAKDLKYHLIVLLSNLFDLGIGPYLFSGWSIMPLSNIGDEWVQVVDLTNRPMIFWEILGVLAPKILRMHHYSQFQILRRSLLTLDKISGGKGAQMEKTALVPRTLGIDLHEKVHKNTSLEKTCPFVIAHHSHHSLSQVICYIHAIWYTIHGRNN